MIGHELLFSLAPLLALVHQEDVRLALLAPLVFSAVGSLPTTVDAAAWDDHGAILHVDELPLPAEPRTLGLDVPRADSALASRGDRRSAWARWNLAAAPGLAGSGAADGPATAAQHVGRDDVRRRIRRGRPHLYRLRSEPEPPPA